MNLLELDEVIAVEELKLLCAIGWYFAIISPFVWRLFFNWYDEKNKDNE